ncbi:uncharacterized protein C13orf46 homolog isoform X2 [Ochotona princeps]|uniref:uncharacterized protein C13orf46 homolog isoform X2 n=1 Tax=Ochotona princeps TaxID=9978 RepID=UPI002714C9E2|nr:uncharacterized protein C13orf46 homolog isoform X2 [Ochotona princeps]
MEKDLATAHRRHRPGTGTLLSGGRMASEVPELQRSRSEGALHQKGDPPGHVRKVAKDLESEEQEKEQQSHAEDADCQANMEEDKRLRGQDTPRNLGRESGCRDPEPECSDSEASANEEEQEAEPMESIPEAQKSSVFVEIDLGDHTEEVTACTPQEEKQSPMDPDLFEDETRTSWVCCIPYTTKKKAKDSA